MITLANRNFAFKYYYKAQNIEIRQSDLGELQEVGQGCGLWINKFSVQNCVRKIFISRQQQNLPKIAKCQKNRVINSFPYMQFFFSLDTLLFW